MNHDPTKQSAEEIAKDILSKACIQFELDFPGGAALPDSLRTDIAKAILSERSLLAEKEQTIRDIISDKSHLWAERDALLKELNDLKETGVVKHYMKECQLLESQRDALIEDDVKNHGIIGKLILENKELSAQLEAVRGALEKGAELIESEYCSHSEPHGDHASCYAQELHKALSTIPSSELQKAKDKVIEAARFIDTGKCATIKYEEDKTPYCMTHETFTPCKFEELSKALAELDRVEGK